MQRLELLPGNGETKGTAPTYRDSLKKIDNTGFCKILRNSAVTGMKDMCFISVAVIKCCDQKQLREEITYLGFLFRREKSPLRQVKPGSKQQAWR